MFGQVQLFKYYKEIQNIELAEFKHSPKHKKFLWLSNITANCFCLFATK